MMGPLISVIIPVYNVEEYLKECIDSVINQTYQRLEIILVDDGSSDASGKICDEYVKEDNRIKVIHKENGGLSDARNMGLDVCCGEYISFVDSDDWISTKMFERLVQVIKKEKADVVFFHSAYVYGKSIKSSSFDKYKVLENKHDMIKEMFVGKGQTIAACLKIYHRRIFDNNRFLVGKTNEDAFIILDIIERTNRMVIIPDVLYYYRQRIGSITRTKKWNKNIMDTVLAYKYNMDIITNKYPESIDAAEKRLLWAYCISLSLAAGTVDYQEHLVEIDELRHEFKRNFFQVFRNKYMYVENVVDSLMAMYFPFKLYVKFRNWYREL
ncbi:MAG: glycosyltransferase family 2 protein [Butyrivibrio sp.]|nr:glycosyltransferase family 2 protein [Butyrivibrio sp.]